MTEHIHPAQLFLSGIARYPSASMELGKVDHRPHFLRVLDPSTFRFSLQQKSPNHAHNGATIRNDYSEYLDQCRSSSQELRCAVAQMTPETGTPETALRSATRIFDNLSAVVMRAWNLLDSEDPLQNEPKLQEAQAALSQSLALGGILRDAFEGLSVFIAFDPDPIRLFCRYIEFVEQIEETARGARPFLIGGQFLVGNTNPANGPEIIPAEKDMRDPRNIKFAEFLSIPSALQKELLKMGIMFVGEYWIRHSNVDGRIRRIVDDLLRVSGIAFHDEKATEWRPPSIEDDPTLDRSVDNLELSVRSSTCLQNENIRLIGELVRMNGHALLEIKNLGISSLKDIKKALAEMGLCLNRNVGQWKPKISGGI